MDAMHGITQFACNSSTLTLQNVHTPTAALWNIYRTLYSWATASRMKWTSHTYTNMNEGAGRTAKMQNSSWHTWETSKQTKNIGPLLSTLVSHWFSGSTAGVFSAWPKLHIMFSLYSMWIKLSNHGRPARSNTSCLWASRPQIIARSLPFTLIG